MTIRPADPTDHEAIRRVHREAFEEDGAVVELVSELLRTESEPKSLHLVAEENGGLVGHVSFTPVHVRSDGSLVGFVLSPLGVVPRHQRGGVGTSLVRRGLELLGEQDVDAVLVYGAPGYYGRFGFETAPAGNYIPPCPLKHPHGWQVTHLGGKAPTESPIEIRCVEALERPELW